MAVQYVDITTLTEYTGDDLSGNEPIQVSASAFTTIGGIADFGEKKFGDRPTILVIPNSLLTLSESSSSAAISNVINSVASGWNDFMSKVSSANLVYSRTGLAALNQYRIFTSTVTSNLTNSVSFYDVANNQLTSRVIKYNSSADTYSIKITNYDLNSIVGDIPSGAFKYQTSNVFDYPKPGDYILGIYSQGTSVINLKASDFLVNNNHVCKIALPAVTTKVQIVTDNGIPPLVTDAAWEPSDFGGGTQDKIVYTITAFASHNNPSASQVWFFVDAELYRLRAE